MIILGALGVVAFAMVSLEGWGRLVVAAVVRATRTEPDWDIPGVRGAIGIALTASVIGLFVLLRVPALVPFWVLAGAGLVGWVVRPPRGALRREAVRANGWRILFLVVLAAWLTVWTLASPTFNPCDDDVAYIPFVHELLHVGGLVQPYSQRRIGTLGAWMPTEFWGYLSLGPRGALIGDALICPLLAAAALLWSSRRWPGIVIGGAGALAATLAPIGRINFGPNGITVLMLVAVGIVAARTARGDPRGRMAGTVIAAALAGQLVGYRLHYAAVALIPLAVVVFWPPRSWRLLGASVAGAVVPLLGWSIASWIDTGTPLFPWLGTGTLNPDWHGYKDPLVHGFHALYGRALDLLSYSDAGIDAVVLIVLGALAFVVGGRLGWRRAVPLGMAAAALVTIVLFPVLITTGAVDDSWRLIRPLLIGSLLVLLADLAASQTLSLRPRGDQALMVGMAAAAGVLLAFWVGQIPWSQQITNVRNLGTGIKQARAFSTDPYAPLKGEYTALRRALPSSAVVAYTADEGDLLDGAGKRSYNLDILGANSPGGHMPFFRGAAAKIDYLRSQGITELVTVDPAGSACLYRTDSWVANTTGPRRVYQLWAPYYNDWFKDLPDLLRSGPTRSFGELRLTQIRS
jgi:hypothetical protein